jgi:hypothetical protein
MRCSTATVVACGLVAALAGCGAAAAPAPLPPSGTAYRALAAGGRLAVATSCRDRAAVRANGVAARQLRAVDPKALQTELDEAVAYFSARKRSVAAICADRLPFVTPGLRMSFAGAKAFDAESFTYDTTSDKRLTIRGALSPPPTGGHVVVRREGEASMISSAQIRAGRFVIPRLRLRKQADNTFVLTIHGPPNAPRKVYFSALCLDCLAGAPAPSSRQ